MNKRPIEFDMLLPKLRKKLFHGKIERFGIQKYWYDTKEFKFDWIYRAPIPQDFIDHFFKNGIDMGRYKQGCLGFVPLQQDDIITQVVIDCDDAELKQFAIKQIIPKYNELKIDWFLEHGGKDNDRCHLRTLIDKVNKDTVKAFYRQFFAELGEPILGRDDEIFLNKKIRFDEVYGVNKLKQLIRFPYGFNAKPDRNKRYPCEYNGEDIDDVISVMEALLKMQPITEDYMKSLTKPDYFPEKTTVSTEGYVPRNITYEPINLPLPIDYIPKQIQPVFQNCQALHGMLTEAVEEKLIEDPGQIHHDAGLAIAGTFRYVNVRYNTEEGRKAWDRLKSEYRLRSDKAHNWWHGEDKEPWYYIWTCEKYDEWYGRCSGCPFAGKIRSPRDFIYGKKLSVTTFPSDMRLVTLQYIREVTFPEFNNMIIEEVKKLKVLDEESPIDDSE